ncbi:MAG: hypothetical protein Q9225_004755 [Loekoesia sp. 1 TL-2023]
MDSMPGSYGGGNNYGGGAMMNGGANQKSTMDMSSGSNTPVVDTSVVAISSCAGGNAPVQQMAQPPMAKGMMHKVTVGGDGLVFSPDTIMAAPGDMVEFTFMKQNHTVTQSTFAMPCVKMQGGADSGFMPNMNDTMSPPPTFMFQVMDTKPAWFYCKQKKPVVHCGKGMTFSINPAADKTQAMFMQMAMQQNGTAGGSMSMGSSSMTSMMTTSTQVAAAAPPPATSSPPPAAMPPPASMPAAAAPPPPPPSSMPAAAAAPASQPPQNMAAPPAMAPGSSMVMGTGSMTNGQCSCSCLCGTAAFPAGAGMGMYGGYSGAVPMS